MAKGRKNISDEQKRLRGTDQPCRTTKGKAPKSVSSVSESVILPDNPSQNGQAVSKSVTLPTLSSLPKSGLKGTAKKVYTLVATELMNRGALDVLSADLVVAYCREMALYHDMMRDLDKEGMTIEIETKNGTMTQTNPKRKIAEGALSSAKSLASEFGLTPASRARVLALFVNNAPKDDFADFESIEEQ